jgi:hypothetical protein
MQTAGRSKAGYSWGMRIFDRVHRDRWAGIAAVLLPLAVAAVFLPWRSSLANSDMALLLVVVVVAVAANGHRVAGIVAAASAALWFDFFWTVPYERLSITRGTDIQTTVLLLAVGAAVSELAARARRARRTVVYDTAYLAELRSTARLVADRTQPQDVVEHVRAQLVMLLGLRAARFEPGRILGHPPRLADDGTLLWDGKPWNVESYGFPDTEFELLARSGGRTLGRFMLTPLPGATPSLAARQVAAMLAAQVGAVLARDAGRVPVEA